MFIVPQIVFDPKNKVIYQVTNIYQINKKQNLNQNKDKNIQKQVNQYMNQNLVQNNNEPKQYKKDIIDIPNFRLIKKGKGIDNKEYNIIIHSAYESLKAKEDPLSQGVIKRIKTKIKGEWMIVVNIEGLSGFDFSLSIVTGNDYLSFAIKDFLFQVFRLRH